MAAIKYADNILLVRSIQRELRRLIKKSPEKQTANSNEPLKISPSVTHMLELLRDNEVTEERFCRPRDHYKYFAETYLTYLKSTRLREELTSKYFNKTERSVEMSARLVGLKLPKRHEEEH